MGCEQTSNGSSQFFKKESRQQQMTQQRRVKYLLENDCFHKVIGIDFSVSLLLGQTIHFVQKVIQDITGWVRKDEEEGERERERLHRIRMMVMRVMMIIIIIMTVNTPAVVLTYSRRCSESSSSWSSRSSVDKPWDCWSGPPHSTMPREYMLTWFSTENPLSYPKSTKPL